MERVTGILYSVIGFLYSILRAFYRLAAGDNRNNSNSSSTEPLIQSDEKRSQQLYEAKFGVQHPLFFEGTFNQLIDRGKSSHKPILVYLHSQEHENTHIFVEKIMSNEAFEVLVNQNFLFYLLDISTKSGFQLSSQLGATTYPFLCVIAIIQNKPKVMKIFELTGILLQQVEVFLGNLRDVYETIDAQYIVEKNEEVLRNLSRTEKEEQDRAYLASLERDKELEEKRKQKELEEKQKLENEERLKLQKEKELLNLKETREYIRRNFPKEPDSLTSIGDQKTGNEICLIRFKFPDGSQLQRKFLKLDKGELLYQFVHILDGSVSKWVPKETSTLNDYQLTTSYPKKKLDPQKTLFENDCHPSQTIFVLENDPEE